MTQVDKVFDVPFYKGELGLELEAEFKLAPPVFQPFRNKGWAFKHDDSLRGHSGEYISKTDVFNNADKTAMLRYLMDTLIKYGPHPGSPRTSFHVHVNVQKFHIHQVYAVMCAYWLLENLLMKFCGEEREGNHFCLRASDAEFVVKEHVKNVKEGLPFHLELRNEHLRYLGLNLASVPKLGSIEFRGMRGLTCPKLMDVWSSNVHLLANKVKKKFETPSEFMDTYFSVTPEELLKTLFRPSFAHELMSYKHWQDLISENEGLVCDLAYCVDWADYNMQHGERKQKVGGLEARIQPRRGAEIFPDRALMQRFLHIQQAPPPPQLVQWEVLDDPGDGWLIIRNED